MFANITVRNSHARDGQQPSSMTIDRFAQLSKLQALPDADVKAILNAAYLAGKALGRKFVADDIQGSQLDLMQAAMVFAQRYEGTFGYMLDMQHDLGKWGSLSPAKAAGVLNCLMAEARRKLAQRAAAAPKTTPAVAATGSTPVAQDEAPEALGPQVPDGYYTVSFEDGQHRTYRLISYRPDEVTKAAQRGYPVPSFAQHVSLLIGPENTSDYARFAVVAGEWIISRKQDGWVSTYQGKQATSEQLSRADAGLRILLGAGEDSLTAYGRAYAQASGNCYVCGRLLTDPTSISLGIGPVCREGN